MLLAMWCACAEVDKFREKLSVYDDFSKSFKKYNPKIISNLEFALEKQIPKLMKQLPGLKRNCYHMCVHAHP